MEQLKSLLVIYSKRGADLGKIPGAKYCDDCAFKADTRPNIDPNFIDTIAGQFEMGGALECHINEGKICAGFQYWKKFFDAMDKRNACNK